MQIRFASIVTSCAVALLCVTSVAAQTPDPHVIASPTYTSIPMEIDVTRPAAAVWQRVGKYCDIGEWLGIACTMTSGVEGEIGSVRSVGREVLVGKTEAARSVAAVGALHLQPSRSRPVWGARWCPTCPA